MLKALQGVNGFVPPELVRSEVALVLVLPDFNGVSLADYQEQNSLGLTEKFTLANRLCLELGKIHDAGVIHRDVHPSNVWFDSTTGRLQFFDFSNAGFMDDVGALMADTASFQGRLTHIAPECTGKVNRCIDWRSDLYSLGVSLFELFTGQLPFDDADLLKLVHMHIAMPAPSLQKAAPDLPRSVSDIVTLFLEKDPDDRYQSAQGAAFDFEHCLNNPDHAHGGGQIALGVGDFSPRLRLSQKLYGRGKELCLLREACERCAAGGRELVAIAGKSGVGKTSLIREMEGWVLKEKGLLAQGKFDQKQGGAPLSAVSAVLQNLTSSLLGKSAEELAEWKVRLMDALGCNGRLVTDLAPELELILEEQPPVPPLSPMDAQLRLHNTLQNFISVFVDRGRPLVLFLDDLQWTDSGSIRFFTSLLQDAPFGNLLLLAAYRDNEVGPEHPLFSTLGALRKQQGLFSEIQLAPLAQVDITAWLADCLGESKEKAASLASVLLKKTQGNPFYLRQFLKTLLDEGEIFRAGGSRRWEYDLTRITRRYMSDDLARLTTRKLAQLPESTRAAIQRAACLGNRFDAFSLAVILQLNEEETLQTLTPALQKGVVYPVIPPIADDASSRALGAPCFEFAHDQVQQAAYEQLSLERRREIRLGVGRLLLEQRGVDGLGGDIFEVVDHLNVGGALLGERERRLAAKLNLQAGLRAKDTSAFGAALRYFQAGLQCLGAASEKSVATDEDADEYDVWFPLTLEQARMHSWEGEYEKAQALVTQAAPKARGVVDQALLQQILIEQYTVSGRLQDAVKLGAQTLKSLGIDIPDQAGEQDVAAAWKDVNNRALNLSFEKIIRIPEARPHAFDLWCAILASLAGPLSFFDESLWRTVVIKLFQLTLDHGVNPLSGGALICHGMLLIDQGEYARAKQAAHIAFQLQAQAGSAFHDAPVTTIYLLDVAPWLEPAAQIAESADDIIHKARSAGHYLYASLLLGCQCIHRAVQNSTLKQRMEVNTQAVDLAKKMHSSLAQAHITGDSLVLHNMMQSSAGALDFDSPDLREADFLATLEQHKPFFAWAHYWTYKAFALYLHHETPAAQDALNMVGAFSSPPVRLSLLYAEYRLVSGLVLLHGEGELQKAQKKLIESIIHDFSMWAEHCETNFSSALFLLQAEHVRRHSQSLEAADYYQKSILAARRSGCLRNEALANELAGRFWLSRGVGKVGKAYLIDARELYHDWGAVRKVHLLGERFKGLADGGGCETIHSEQSLELGSMMKAAQAISSRLNMEELLPAMLSIICESAGAQNGVLLLTKGAELAPRAIFLNAKARLLSHHESKTFNGYAASIVNAVARAKNHVLVDDAGNSALFQDDEHIAKQRSLSILCLPVSSGDELLGVLYCENNLSTHAFAHERVGIVNLLAMQAAVSIQNAALYSELELAEEKYRNIVENSIAGIFRMSPEGELLTVNPAAAEILGYNAVAQTLSPGDDHAENFIEKKRQDEVLEMLHRDGRVKDAEMELRTKDGKSAWISLSARMVYDGKQSPMYAEGFIEDISDRKSAREEIRKLNSELLAIQESERQRISRDLHDDVAQGLVSLKIGLDLLARKKPGLRDEPDARELIHGLSGKIQDAIAKVRDISNLLRPPELERLGLRRSVAILCRELADELGMDVSFHSLGMEKIVLTDDEKINVYRFVQEALNNIRKHSDAMKAEVALLASHPMVIVRVVDYGVGFDPSQEKEAGQGGKMGLRTMRERARQLGGRLTMNAVKGKGVKLTLRFPEQGSTV